MIVFVKPIPESEGEILSELAIADEERNRAEAFINEQVKNNCLKAEAVERYSKYTAELRSKVRGYNSRLLALIPYEITVSDLKWDWGTDTAHNMLKVYITDDNISPFGVDILEKGGFQKMSSLINAVVPRPVKTVESATVEGNSEK